MENNSNNQKVAAVKFNSEFELKRLLFVASKSIFWVAFFLCVSLVGAFLFLRYWL